MISVLVTNMHTYWEEEGKNGVVSEIAMQHTSSFSLMPQ